jgi:hypothetical protein
LVTSAAAAAAAAGHFLTLFMIWTKQRNLYLKGNPGKPKLSFRFYFELMSQGKSK